MTLGAGEVTASRLNVRDKPFVKRNGRSSRVLAQLVRGDRVDVDASTGQWLEVRKRPGGRPAGFVHSDYIRMLASEGPAPPDFLSRAADLADADDDMRPVQRLDASLHAGTRRAPLVRLWNRCGGLISHLAQTIGITPGTACAVLQVESGGAAFSSGPDRRMIIRFENHVFWRRWGKTSRARQERFEDHFRFSRRKPWQKHEFRSGRRWEKCHKSGQAGEWKVFEFAASLDREAEEQAACSISMGAPQIMGFNHARIGFATAQEMFVAFSQSEGAQIRDLFDFIKGPGSSSDMLAALQRGDLEAFATGYNGPGQAPIYSGRLEDQLERFTELARLEPSLRAE